MYQDIKKRIYWYQQFFIDILFYNIIFMAG